VSVIGVLTACFLAAGAEAGATRDLGEVKAAGVLRHLGSSYANFVTGQGDGLDVELVQRFAAHLGVRYEFVEAGWDTIFTDLTGLRFAMKNGDAVVTGQGPVRGDIIANGLTVLPWRAKLLDFSTPTFPTQVWLVVKADSPVAPIVPTGDIAKDIGLTRAKLGGLTLLCKSGTCLDPALYNLGPTGAVPREFPGGPNDLAPAIILGEADATLLDVPDALIALQKFPGKIKVIGPLNDTQDMAACFAKTSPRLREEFNRFFAGLRASGDYDSLVRKYYPLVYSYFPAFFR
jgi:ABC-type amino acid transport substrate-binding protein